MSNKLRDCPLCKNKTTCKNCSGTGNSNIFGKKCKPCDGTGKCPRCKGDGYIPRN